MAAEGTRAAWTDERLDDFRADVSGRFDGVDRRLERIDQRFDRIEERFDRIDARFDALYRTMIAVGGGMIASILVGTAGIAATQI